MTSYAYLDVEAETAEEAYAIADSTDGGEFISDEFKGDWEVDPDCDIQEVDE